MHLCILDHAGAVDFDKAVTVSESTRNRCRNRCQFGLPPRKTENRTNTDSPAATRHDRPVRGSVRQGKALTGAIPHQEAVIQQIAAEQRLIAQRPEGQLQHGLSAQDEVGTDVP